MSTQSLTANSSNAGASGGGMLSNVKIGTRIAGGFAVILVVLIVLGAMGWFGLSNSGDGFATYARIADNHTLITETQAGLLNMRRFGREYALTGNKQLIEGWDKKKAEVAKPLATYIGTTVNAERKAKAEKAQEVMQAWYAAADKVFALRDKHDAMLNGVLVEAGPKVQSDLIEIVNASGAAHDADGAVHAGIALDDLMNARLAARGFQEAGDAKFGDAYRAAMEKFDLDVAPLAARLQDGPLKTKLADAMDNLKKYQGGLRGALRRGKSTKP